MKLIALSAAPILNVLFLTFASPTAHAQLASQISSGSENPVIPGEVVWADLITTDVEAAVAFYSSVFGWERIAGDDPRYVEMAHDGELICAVAEFAEQDVTPGDARWLVSLSVANVDETAEKIRELNGNVLEGPDELPNRGRLAVVADDQGAMLAILRATGGDPPRTKDPTGSWAWAELWTRDVDKAVGFYEAAFGYSAVRVDDAAGEPPVVLETADEPRATIVRIPWDFVEPNWLPYVLVADGRQTLERILDAGGSVLFTSDDTVEDTGTYAAIVADPTGGVFAIQEKEAKQ